jgi:magnesium transporter
VFVRGLAFGEIDLRSGSWPIVKELFVGIGNGVGNGLVTGLVVGLWTGDWRLASVLCLAMIINMTVAGVAGGLVPLALKELGFDPAISSSIFVTTCTDVAGFFSFLGLATLALHYWKI